MKKICQKHGLTLVELIVSSLLIAIVLLGVVAFNLSLKQIQDNSFNQSTLSTQSSTAMNYIDDDIAMAIGNNNNPGVSPLSGSYPSLCLRQPDSRDPDPTPRDFNDNPWICYILDSTDNNLKRCAPCLTTGAPFCTVAFNPKTTPFNSSSQCVSQTINLVKLQTGDFFTIGDNVTPPGPGLITITLHTQDGTSHYDMSTNIQTKNHTQ